MQLNHTASTPGAIWTRLLKPDHGDMAPEAARFFLDLSFDQHDLDRMEELATRNQEGKLSPEERAELMNYRQVGLELDLLRAKAMLTLKQCSPALDA
jgi:hypothetical protein